MKPSTHTSGGELGFRVWSRGIPDQEQPELPSLHPIICVSVPHPLLLSNPAEVSDQVHLRFHYFSCLSNYLAKYWAGL